MRILSTWCADCVFLLSLSVGEASSSNGTSAVPFLVISEITVDKNDNFVHNREDSSGAQSGPMPMDNADQQNSENVSDNGVSLDNSASACRNRPL